MPKTVTIQYAGGQSKTVILGVEECCCTAHPRGWGTSCETFNRKADGLYHCEDCGLVYKKLVRHQEPNTKTIPCECGVVVNFLEWYWNDFYGYECPTTLYKCTECDQVYREPYVSEAASVHLQESPCAKRITSSGLKMMGKHHLRNLNSTLEKRVSELSPGAKYKFLKQLTKT